LKKAYYEPYFKATEPLYIKPREFSRPITCGLYLYCAESKLISDIGEITLSKPRAGFNGFKLPEVAKVKES